MSVTILRELQGFRGQACLVQDEETQRFFVVSSVDPRDMMAGLGGLIGSLDMFGPETLVFPAHEDGSVTDWGEVAGGRGTSRIQAIAELTTWLRAGCPDRYAWDNDSDTEDDD